MPDLVLYVEDNPANFALVEKVLAMEGSYEVVGAETGAAGLEFLEARTPSLILLDLDLPDIGGLEVARRVGANPAIAHIPMVAVSASVMKNERKDAAAVGCCAFIEKPFDIDVLRDTVARAIAGKLSPTK